MEEIDSAKVISVIIFILILLGVFLSYYFYRQHENDAPYRATCESNPRLRYATDCGTYEECVKRCVERTKSFERGG